MFIDLRANKDNYCLIDTFLSPFVSFQVYVWLCNDNVYRNGFFVIFIIYRRGDLLTRGNAFCRAHPLREKAENWFVIKTLSLSHGFQMLFRGGRGDSRWFIRTYAKSAPISETASSSVPVATICTSGKSRWWRIYGINARNRRDSSANIARQGIIKRRISFVICAFTILIFHRCSSIGSTMLFSTLIKRSPLQITLQNCYI